jgi:hypothetical protein
MHRSGTSLVTRLLNLSGLYLGQEHDLEPAAQDNPEGYWENQKFVRLNDRLLSELGGGWDFAPRPGLGTQETDGLRRLKEQARVLVREFEDCEPWGWKDPRSSLLAPFWLNVLPDLRFVICVRNPLEVAQSLYRRNLFSVPRSLTLWKEYNEQLLAATHPQRRVITAYDAYFGDPEPELTRVTAFLGLPMREETLAECALATRLDLRHNRAYVHQLLDSSVPREVFDLYMAMCDEADWREGGRRAESDAGSDAAPSQLADRPHPVRQTAGGRVRGELQEQLTAIHAEIEGVRRDQALTITLGAELQDRGAEVDQLQARLRGSEAEVARLQAELEVRTRDQEMILGSDSWRLTGPLRTRWLSAPLKTIARAEQRLRRSRIGRLLGGPSPAGSSGDPR